MANTSLSNQEPVPIHVFSRCLISPCSSPLTIIYTSAMANRAKIFWCNRKVIFVWCVKQKYRDQEWRSTVRGNPRPRGVILGPGNELQIHRWRAKDELVVWLFSEGFSPCLEDLWCFISVLVFKMVIFYINIEWFGLPFFPLSCTCKRSEICTLSLLIQVCYKSTPLNLRVVDNWRKRNSK